MYGLLNYASLLLGLIAWAVPGAAIGLRRRSGWLTAVSFALCSMSLQCQMLYTGHLVEIGDWSALADTHYAVVGAAWVLLGGTAGLNLLTLAAAKEN